MVTKIELFKSPDLNALHFCLWSWSRSEFYKRTVDTRDELLTPCSRVLEKLTGFQLVKKFPALYGTRRFITAFTSARHLSLSWASSIQSISPHPTSWRSILILSSHLRLALPSGLFPPPQVSPPKPCTHLSPHPYALHAPPISFFSILSPAQYWVRSTEH